MVEPRRRVLHGCFNTVPFSNMFSSTFVMSIRDQVVFLCVLLLENGIIYFAVGIVTYLAYRSKHLSIRITTTHTDRLFSNF